MSAFDTLPDPDFSQMMPGLLALFAKKGWVVLVWGILLLPVGFGIQAVALIKTRIIPSWQSTLFLVGVLFIGVPDGVEIVNLTASVLLTAAFIPYGIPEDPVMGSAYTQLAPYWASKMGSKRFSVKQVSPRGGELTCEIVDDRVHISGKAIKYLEGKINIET